MLAQTSAVTVAGGDLAIEVLPGSTEPILAIHGISSNRKLWGWLRTEAPQLSLIAPDLRGRGDSLTVSGTSSIGQHAEDMVAVLDSLGIDRVHVCGMSMGGFVAVELAARFPDRVRSLILVDGGVPMAAPPGLTEENIPLAFASRLARLEKPWDSAADYAAFFLDSTAPLVDRAAPEWLSYLEHDLRDGRVFLSAQALCEDVASSFFGASRLAEVSAPMRFLHAQWSIGTDSPPAYPEARIADYQHHLAGVTPMPGCDHAGSIMTRKGAGMVAGVIAQAMA